MKTSSLLLMLVVYGNAFCKETDSEGQRSERINMTSEDSLLLNLIINPQSLRPGTILGMVVASIVVVIGSFLVLWRLCCDVEMVVSREVMVPLTSISQKVAKSSPICLPIKTASRGKLLVESFSNAFDID